MMRTHERTHISTSSGNHTLIPSSIASRIQVRSKTVQIAAFIQIHLHPDHSLTNWTRGQIIDVEFTSFIVVRGHVIIAFEHLLLYLDC